MKKVYLVSEGAYSDYGIVAVFADEELAESFAAELGGRVETYDLLEEGPERIVVWSSEWRNGEVRTWSWTIWSHESDYARRPRIDEGEAPKGYWIRASGLDRKATIKAVADRGAQRTAELEGIS